MNNINLNELRNRAYKTACEHGFHDKELSNEHCLCLIVGELMEAVEADRKGNMPTENLSNLLMRMKNRTMMSISSSVLKNISKIHTKMN